MTNLSRRAGLACGLWLLLGSLLELHAQEGWREGFADSQGVKIHYVTAGEGPLVVLLHGFPDFHYTWRDQIPALAKTCQVVALDLRGYNTSDQPTGVENYTLDKLVADVVAVVRHLGRERATIVGHDWGGAIAWNVALRHPELTERLVILNLPHPRGLLRELKNNPEQRKNSAYARAFQLPGAAAALTPEAIAGWVREPEAREKYVAAFRKSSLEGMLNYYRANYPREPYEVPAELPQVKCPVLMIHGLDDTALLPGALNDTWQWIDNEFSLVTIPKAGHFVHRDQPERVTRALVDWLAAHPVAK
jgi:pimeloyl-ACP methyl ester carboxylesterase